jgi:hypothetical protein
VVLLGTMLVLFAVQLVRERTELAARRLFLASVVYLPLLLLLLMLDSGPRPALGGGAPWRLDAQAAETALDLTR